MNRRLAILQPRKDTVTENGAERTALAFRRRQLRRDVLKQRRAPSKRSGLTVRDHLPSHFSSTSCSSRLNRTSRTVPATTFPGPSCEVAEVSPGVHTPQSEIDRESMTSAGAVAPEGDFVNATRKSGEEIGLQDASCDSTNTGWDAEHFPITMPEEAFPGNDVEQALWVAANRPARPQALASMPDPTSPEAIFHTDPFGISGFEALDVEPLEAPFLPPLEHMSCRSSPSSTHVEVGTPMGRVDRRSWSPSPAEQPDLDWSPSPPNAEQPIFNQPWSPSPAEQPHLDWSPSPPNAEQPIFNQPWSPSPAEFPGPPHFGRAYSPNYADHPHFDNFCLDILPDVPGGSESVDQLAAHIPLWPQSGSPQVAAVNQPQ
ncbi:hypothetical protein WJX74_008519 [Apatococcus lobatus]|uniref:Uncharacterized protein n=1 Tax=Apatococcus lobatus TaxID=904363 RepID=A0AAW1QX80_9CHLO